MAKPLLPDQEDADEPDEDNSGPIGDSAYARDVAEYLGDMIRQLEGMARSAGLELLVYLLGMARLEAEANARERADPPRAARR